MSTTPSTDVATILAASISCSWQAWLLIVGATTCKHHKHNNELSYFSSWLAAAAVSTTPSTDVATILAASISCSWQAWLLIVGATTCKHHKHNNELSYFSSWLAAAAVSTTPSTDVATILAASISCSWQAWLLIVGATTCKHHKHNNELSYFSS